LPRPPQVTGSKRVLLWPPSAHDDLYVTGSSSPITHLHDQQALRQRYPRFAAAQALEARLAPGDCLYIPALWFHNVVSEDFAVSVNLFWRHLPPAFYERKDLYGNRDLVQVGRRGFALQGGPSTGLPAAGAVRAGRRGRGCCPGAGGRGGQGGRVAVAIAPAAGSVGRSRGAIARRGAP
jgi:hypothetical protein